MKRLEGQVLWCMGTRHPVRPCEDGMAHMYMPSMHWTVDSGRAWEDSESSELAWTWMCGQINEDAGGDGGFGADRNTTTVVGRIIHGYQPNSTRITLCPPRQTATISGTVHSNNCTGNDHVLMYDGMRSRRADGVIDIPGIRPVLQPCASSTCPTATDRNSYLPADYEILPLHYDHEYCDTCLPPPT